MGRIRNALFELFRVRDGGKNSDVVSLVFRLVLYDARIDVLLNWHSSHLRYGLVLSYRE